MKILLVHNYYRQPGGEDTVMSRTSMVLKTFGHDVIEYTRSNHEIENYGLLKKIAVPINALWSQKAYRDISNLIDTHKPDIAQFCNTFLMISPAAYYACRKKGVLVVQSLDNQRLMCPGGSFFRKGDMCEDCLGRIPAWPGILHACYRKSYLQTVVVAALVAFHTWKKTWKIAVDRYLVATDFYKQKFIAAGLPEGKLTVKPHFVYPDPGMRPEQKGEYALFIGRLDPEKGLTTLVSAFRQVQEIPLRIRGKGQMLDEIKIRIREEKITNVTLVQEKLEKNELFDLIKGAQFLVFPSEGYYETFGLVMIEAFACGVPVIASRIGVMEEIVCDKETGLFFEPGNVDDLKEKLTWAHGHPDEIAQMGRNARKEFELKYTAEKNVESLITIYEQLLNRK